MNKTLYDSIGGNYKKTRTADNRILETIKNLLGLPLGSIIADIGAGSGNYSNALAKLGYKVKSVEPSEAMRNQATPHNYIDWFSGSAESIPLSDNSVNGVIVILAIHHFHSVQDAIAEIHRICPSGPVVLLTLDPRESEALWFEHYFPEISQQEFVSFPPIDEIANVIANCGNWSETVYKFPLPYNLSDLNMRAGWNRPELYLDLQAMRNTSGFALASESVVQKGAAKLRNDLQSGKWDAKYGYLRTQKKFDAGFRFIKCIA